MNNPRDTTHKIEGKCVSGKTRTEKPANEVKNTNNDNNNNNKKNITKNNYNNYTEGTIYSGESLSR